MSFPIGLGSWKSKAPFEFDTDHSSPAKGKQGNNLLRLIGSINFADGRWSLGFSEAGLIVVPII